VNRGTGGACPMAYPGAVGPARFFYTTV